MACWKVALILKIKRQLPISKHNPSTNESNFVLILWVDQDLIIAGEPIHE